MIVQSDILKVSLAPSSERGCKAEKDHFSFEKVHKGLAFLKNPGL